MEQSSTSMVQGVLVTLGGFVSQVYAWMAAALVVSGGFAYLINTNAALQVWFYYNEWAFLLLFLAELGLVIAISGFVNKLNASVAAVLFFIYAAINGLFLGILVSLYAASSVFLAFGATAGLFGVMAAYGLLTRRDLTHWRNLLFMGLVGIIIASVLNIFLASSTVEWIITYLGIALFLGLTAYDSNKIKKMAAAAESSGRATGLAVAAALSLYLDFINLFLFLLRAFGKRR